MNDKPKAKRPRKRWKRILKWSVFTILLALFVWFEIAYWRSTNDCGHTAASGESHEGHCLLRLWCGQSQVGRD